jgi:hypothetical protein
MRFFYLAVMGVGLTTAILAGCSQQHNQTGPSGTQTVYTFAITPAAPQGVYAAACPLLVSGKSAVVCSVSRGNTSLSGMLPLSYAEGGGQTNYTYTQTTGQVNLAWSNSNNYVPPAFTLTVTVVNN